MDLVNALMAQAINKSDPEKLAGRDYVKSLTDQAKSEAIATRAHTVSVIEENLAKAKDNDAPQSVIDAYERLLVTASTQ